MEFLPKEELLTYEEIERLMILFKNMGTKKVRITGGEPLVRRGVDKLALKLHELGFRTALTTNGFALREFLPEFKNSLDSINISLDSVHSETFEKISGMSRSVLKIVINSIITSKEMGIPTKINTVVIKENAFEINDLIDFAKSISIPIRFIEYMTVEENEKKSISFNELKEKIIKSQRLFEVDEKLGDGPAKYYKSDDGATVGFIAYSESHFCDKCNRLRITPDGMLRLCLILGVELDLKELLRSGSSDEEIKDKIINFVKLKPFSHGAYKVLGRKMNSIGG